MYTIAKIWCLGLMLFFLGNISVVICGEMSGQLVDCICGMEWLANP